MELRHLRYFVAVAEEQNVTRAAARLHVSQPPLTRQIHDLEEELGVELFERTGRSIRLTRAGRVFLSGARAALRRVDDAVRAVRATAEGGRDEIHIGYAPTPSAALLPAVLRVFRKAAPRVRVVMHDQSSPEMLSGLCEGRIQAAFMMQPTRTAARGIRFQALRTLPVVVAVAPDHPFARRSAVSMSEVQAEPLVGYSRRQYPDYHEFLARHAGLNSKRVRFAEECDSGSSLITAVASGRGVAITLASLGTAAGRRLRLVPLTPTPKPGIVGIAWRAKDASEQTRRLVQMAVDLDLESGKQGR